VQNFRSVRVDPQARTVTFGAGCALGDVDAETVPYNVSRR
jgi:hypothetical protein